MNERSDFYRGETAESYEAKRAGSSIWKREDQIVEELLRGLANRSSEQTVLDIPVGTGRFAEIIESSGHLLVGMDISQDMLRLANGRASARAGFAIANATALPIRPSIVDAVVCIRFAHLVDGATLATTISEFGRILEDDGFVVIGARLHSIRLDGVQEGRFQRVLRRSLRTFRFRTGRTDSRSHSEPWFRRVVGAAGLRMAQRWEVTRYDDGSHYFICKLRPADPVSKQIRSFELFGLPGVGKSTTARTLLGAGRSDLVDGFGAVRGRSVWECFRAHPFATSRLLMSLLPVATGLRSQAARKVVVAALRQRIVDLEARGMVIHEEGASHELWRQLISGAEISDDFIRRFLPVAEGVILVEASPEVLAERLLTKRSPGPISRSLITEPLDGELWARATATYDRIKGVLEAGSAPVFVIDNSGDSGDALAALDAIVSGENP